MITFLILELVEFVIAKEEFVIVLQEDNLLNFNLYKKEIYYIGHIIYFFFYF